MGKGKSLLYLSRMPEAGEGGGGGGGEGEGEGGLRREGEKGGESEGRKESMSSSFLRKLEP